MINDVEQLIAELTGEASAVKPAPHPYLLGLMLIGAAAIYLSAVLAVSGLRPDWPQAMSQPWFVAEIVALFMLLVTASFSAALLAFPDLHQKRRLAFAPAWMLTLFLVVMLFAWHADNPPATLSQHGIECTSCILLLAILPGVWTFYITRMFASTHCHWAGSSALLAAFSVGALWLRLQEANNSILHVVEWHYLPMLAFGMLGLWLGKWLLRW
ncbi:MAG: DUF1109 domain-containing protein [Georgfuchsia sp.]